MTTVVHTYPGVSPKRQSELGDMLDAANIQRQYLEGSRPWAGEPDWIKITLDDSIPKTRIDKVIDEYKKLDPNAPSVEETQEIEFRTLIKNQNDVIAALLEQIMPIKSLPDTANQQTRVAAIKTLAFGLEAMALLVGAMNHRKFR